MSQLELTDAQWASFAAEFCKGFTKEQQDVCRTFCQVRGLLPGKHVIFNLRQSSEWDESVHAKVKVTKIIFMTTIDASRLIAERTKLYNGQAPEQYIYLDENGSPTIVSEIPLPQLPLPAKGTAALPREPWAVKTTVYRKDFSQPVSSIARFDAYAATYNTNDGPKLNDMWARRGPEQLAKCSEMLSLRKAFPEELGGIYIAEELKPDHDEPTTPVTPASVVPLPPTVPKVDQTPAVGTDAPRPGEIKEKIKEALPNLEKVLANPEIKPALAAEGKQINQEAIDQLKKDVGLTTASELPPPEKKKRGPKPKVKSPDNGQPAAVPGEITDSDFENIGTPPPPEITEADKKSAQEFVESADPTPTKEEMKKFTDRVRALRDAGADNVGLKSYILNVGKVNDTKKLTVNNWTRALTELEALDKDKLREVTKNAPLPAF
jgi:hypothetical protein